MIASAYLYTSFGLLLVENAVVLSKLVVATDPSLPSCAKPKMTMHASMANLALPKKLLSLMPHSLDIL